MKNRVNEDRFHSFRRIHIDVLCHDMSYRFVSCRVFQQAKPVSQALIHRVIVPVC